MVIAECNDKGMVGLTAPNLIAIITLAVAES